MSPTLGLYFDFRNPEPWRRDPAAYYGWHLDLMEEADLWAGEKVLVASIDTAARLEAYVLPGEPGTGRILINGGAANRIKKGERLTIMAFALTETPIEPVKLVLDADNRIVRAGR